MKSTTSHGREYNICKESCQLHSLDRMVKKRVICTIEKPTE